MVCLAEYFSDLSSFVPLSYGKVVRSNPREPPLGTPLMYKEINVQS